MNNLLHNPDDLINFVVVPGIRAEAYKPYSCQTFLHHTDTMNLAICNKSIIINTIADRIFLPETA